MNDVLSAEFKGSLQKAMANCLLNELEVECFKSFNKYNNATKFLLDKNMEINNYLPIILLVI